MKTTTKIYAALLTVLCPLSVPAQENMLKAISDFKAKHLIFHTVEQNGENEGKKWYANMAEFVMPKKKEKLLLPLITAYDLDLPEAYASMKTIAKSAVDYYKNSYDDTHIIAYDDNNMQMLNLGGKAGYSYLMLCVRDKQDSLMRHAITIEWYREGRKIKGAIYDIYGRGPRKKKLKTDRKYRTIVYPNGSTTVVKDGKVRINDGSVQHTSTSLMPDGTVIRDRGDGNSQVIKSDGTISYGTQADDSVKTGEDFMLKFGNLRAAYLDGVREHKELTLQTAVANKIMTLCKKNGHILSKAEKDVCCKTIDDLRTNTDDQYIADLLQIARKELE